MHCLLEASSLQGLDITMVTKTLLKLWQHIQIWLILVDELRVNQSCLRLSTAEVFLMLKCKQCHLLECTCEAAVIHLDAQ